MARKNATISVNVAGDPNSESVSITFNVVGIETPLVLSTDALANDIRSAAMVHGLIQKVSDAAALPKNDDGTPADPADKFAAMESVVSRLLEGDWNKRAGDGTAQPSGLIFRAYYAVISAAYEANGKPVPAESAVREIYDRKDRSAQLALRNNPDIAAEITRLKSATVKTSNVDTDSLLDELGELA